MLARAASEDRVLITVDKDFGELIFRMGRVVLDVILVRLPGLSSTSRADVVVQAVTDHGDEMQGRFTVVSPGLVRIRPPLSA